ncbi:hypothetical protein KSP39_PZI005486 [Platanthera zijinensis]|uniref:Uncharacterized protein n=1 Tax=Platanthera zijinensis TaxID=2320716 RepID=A0AAP0BS46_9ASPA
MAAGFAEVSVEANAGAMTIVQGSIYALNNIFVLNYAQWLAPHGSSKVGPGYPMGIDSGNSCMLPCSSLIFVADVDLKSWIVMQQIYFLFDQKVIMYVYEKVIVYRRMIVYDH